MFEEPPALKGMAEKIARVAALPGPVPAEDFGVMGPPRPHVGRSVRVGMGITDADQAGIILKVHKPVPGIAGWLCDLALLCPWRLSPAPTAVRSLSGQIIGHLDAPLAGPPTGATVMMTLAEGVEEANEKPGIYGWRYAD